MFDHPASVSFRSRTSRLKARIRSSARTARTAIRTITQTMRRAYSRLRPRRLGTGEEYPQEHASVPGGGGVRRTRPRRRLARTRVLLREPSRRPDGVREIAHL